MATITLGDQTVRRNQEGEVHNVSIITADTVDGGDTIDISGVLDGKSIVDFNVFNVEDGVAVGTSTLSSNVVTIQGGASNKTYAINLKLAAT